MGVLYGIGKTLVSRDELLEKAAIGHLRDFAKASASKKPASISFTVGDVSTEDLPTNKRDALPFEPIAMYKPLTMEFHTAFTGDAPSRSFFDKLVGRSKPDLLIVSGAKTPTTVGSAPRAINQLVKDIDDKKSYRPGALREGSSIIYHTPAITESTTYIGVEMVVDSFSGDLFTFLESLFRTAAGLPVFAPAAAYLLAGSSVSKIGSKLAEALSETGPFLKADEDILFNSGGWPIELARFLVFAADNDLSELSGYSPEIIEEAGNTRVTLIHKQSGKEYEGKIPYIIASLDGRPRPEYREFKPQHASAAMLEQFYGNGTITGVTESLKDAMTLYNDLQYHRSAKRLTKQLNNAKERANNIQEQLLDLNEENDKYTELEAELKTVREESKSIEERIVAYKENINSNEFKDVLQDI